PSAWPTTPGYCGLGLRLMPDLFLHKSEVKRRTDPGGVLESITVRGTKAALTIEQDPRVQQNVLYIQGCENGGDETFAFVSLGPANGRGFTVKTGETLTGSYRITVADVP